MNNGDAFYLLGNIIGMLYAKNIVADRFAVAADYLAKYFINEINSKDGTYAEINQAIQDTSDLIGKRTSNKIVRKGVLFIKDGISNIIYNYFHGSQILPYLRLYYLCIVSDLNKGG